MQAPKIHLYKPSQYLLHLFLFLGTLFTTTVAGVFWLGKDPFDLTNLASGLPYSISLLAFLTAHEFGHYFAARFHGVKSTLPYYIPVPPIPPFIINPFGTMGAVIRMKSQIQSKRALFDIGIAGPLAGLVVAVLIIAWGVLTFPGKEHLLSIHPDYAFLDTIPDEGLRFGHSLFSWLMFQYFSQFGFTPPMNEIYHYPYLCVGWFSLFVTALNLIPVGQLDGGHILYAMLGRGQGIFARVFLALLIVIGLSSFLPFIGIGIQPGTVGWLLLAAILFFIMKLDHPPIADETELDPRRRMLGWLTFGIFVITFTPVPFLELIPS